LDADLRWHKMDGSYGVANGPTFGIDGLTLYDTDSAARTIYAFDIAGAVPSRTKGSGFEVSWGYSDGMCTDAEGCIWIGHWEGGRISRFAPEGVHLHSIELPASLEYYQLRLCRRKVQPHVRHLLGDRSRRRAAGWSLVRGRPRCEGMPTPLFAG
jgi:hypothetical protein